MRKLVILAILCLTGTSWAEGFLQLKSVTVKSGFSHELDSGWNYKGIDTSVELGYKIYFLEGYTYLSGQTGWLTLGNLPGGQNLELKQVGFYIYPNLIVGQGFKISKPVGKLFDISGFVEIYSSLHTAVVKTTKVKSDAGPAIDAVLKNSYDANLGTLGFSAGGQLEIAYKLMRFRLAVSYGFKDIDLFTSPKMWSLRKNGLLLSGQAPDMSELDYTFQFFRVGVGADFRLKKWLQITVGGTVDLGKDSADLGIKICGYGFYAGTVFNF